MKFKKAVVILSFLLLVIPFVNGFGITSMYWDTNPLVLEPGKTVDVVLLLQNMVGDTDITLRAELEEGSEIAQIIDSNLDYLVPFGRKDVKVNIRVNIPEDAPLDKEYKVIVSFKQVVQNVDRAVQLTSAIKKTIPIKIVGEGKGVEKTEIPPVGAVAESTSKGEISSLSYYVLIILVVIVLAAFLILRKRNQVVKKLKK